MPSSRSERKRRQAAGRPSRELLELIEVSRAIGGDPDLVQGGGGNTSVKTPDGATMLVKASGTALGEMSEERGWAEVDLPRTLAILEDRELVRLPVAEREADVAHALERAVVRPRGARPSVDACLHALLGRVVLHTHPAQLGALLASQDSREVWEKALGAAGRGALYVPYVDPGLTLARRLAAALEQHVEERGRAPSVVLLENHGLFVSAESAEECIALSGKIQAAARRWSGHRRVNPNGVGRVALVAKPSAGGRSGNGASAHGEGELGSVAVTLRGALLRAGVRPGVVSRDTSDVAEAFIADADAVALARKGVFTPDQIFYARSKPLVLRGKPASWQRAITTYVEKTGRDPRVVIIEGEGVFYCAPDLEKARVVAEVYRTVIVTLLASPAAGGPRFLSRARADFVESWGTKQPGAWPSEGRELEGRIAVVTGGGSGLGKGIALGLVGAGATVFGLDIDASALAEVSASQPAGRFLPLACDVTDESSVAAAYRAVIGTAGGLDFVVNAAGIAPSFPLVDFPLRAWQKTLDINLTGYFLIAREGARWLLAQGAGGGMVNLTSKSGLDASKSNSGYNATKAGEVHLMRGWALELGPAGIRVNCVAPGNVFKGSKIWNDEYIRVCARKKGIRPEQVIPYYTSLAPLGKEIEPEDIASGVLFLLSDAARNVTGQTLVVDGGQVMVR